MKPIIDRSQGAPRAGSGEHGRIVHGTAAATRLRTGLFALVGIAMLYGAWWPFVQATRVDVQFTAAAAIADCLLREP